MLLTILLLTIFNTLFNVSFIVYLLCLCNKSIKKQLQAKKEVKNNVYFSQSAKKR